VATRRGKTLRTLTDSSPTGSRAAVITWLGRGGVPVGFAGGWCPECMPLITPAGSGEDVRTVSAIQEIDRTVDVQPKPPAPTLNLMPSESAADTSLSALSSRDFERFAGSLVPLGHQWDARVI